MSSKVNYREANSFIQWAICEMIGGNSEIFTKEYDPENIEVEMKINGIELDFKRAMLVFKKAMEEHAVKVAKGLVEERIDEKLFNTMEELGKLAEDLKERIQEKIDGQFKHEWEK